MRDLENKRAYNRKYQQEHRKRQTAYMKRYRAKHPEKVQTQKERRRAYDAARYAEDPLWYRTLALLKRYCLSKEEYSRKIKTQNGCCAICFREMNPPNVDHDHRCCPRGRKTCGKCVRDLLCAKCNLAIGFFDENIEFLESAILYLRKWKQNEHLGKFHGYPTLNDCT